MGVRENRLSAEHKAMSKFRSNVMKWESVGSSNPPEVYVVTYDLKSIVGFSNGSPQYHKGFKVEIRFPTDYPRGKPEVRLISSPRPFHPNIWVRDGRFCLEGDQQWIPGIGVPLDSLCLMMGEIIAFQHVNLRSPANPDVTLINWINSNSAKLPVDTTPIRLPDAEDTIQWGKAESAPPPPRIRFG
jgi:ubiquitin-protein ligase